MKVSSLRLAILAGLFSSGAAFAAPPSAAQEIAALKAELQHQKEVAAQQQARLEALESKLNATVDVQRAVAENDAKEKATEKKTLETSAKLGDGLNVKYGKDEIKLYGLIDLTLRNQSNANSKGQSVTDLTTGFFSGSRWGIIGKHNLGWDDGSANVIYKLESEYDLRNGSEDAPGVLFNRDAWIGLESNTLGRVTFGRQNTLGRDFAEVYGIPYAKPDVDVTEGGWTNTNVSKNGIFYLASPTGTRYDGGMVWKKKIGDFVAGAAYQLNSPPPTPAVAVAGDFSNNTTQAVALAYDGPNYTLSSEYNQSKINNFEHKTYTVGGNIRFGGFRVNAGYYRYEAEQAVVGKRTDDNYTVSGSYQAEGSKLQYYLMWEGAQAHNAGLTSAGYTLAAYKPTNGVKLAGSGDRDAYAATIMYHADKRTDFYVVADYMKTSGGYRESVANGYHSVLELCTGLRLRF